MQPFLLYVRYGVVSSLSSVDVSQSIESCDFRMNAFLPLSRSMISQPRTLLLSFYTCDFSPSTRATSLLLHVRLLSFFVCSFYLHCNSHIKPVYHSRHLFTSLFPAHILPTPQD